MIKKLFAQGRIYILPTKLGIYFITITFVLFIFSLSYGNPLAYTATFLFSSIIVVSTIFTNFNLSRVSVKLDNMQSSFFFNEIKIMKIVLINSSNKMKFDIEAEIVKNKSIESISVNKNDNSKLSITLPDLARGEYSISRIKIFSSFPFGLFFAWKYIPIDHRVYIIPSPIGEKQPVSLQGVDDSENGSGVLNGGDDFYQHSPYVPGDSWKRINWKVWAKSDNLLIKQYETSSQNTYSFDMTTLNYLEQEVALSQMSQWVVTAKNNHSIFNVVINGSDASFGSGDFHCERSLSLLASYKKEVVVL